MVSYMINSSVARICFFAVVVSWQFATALSVNVSEKSKSSDPAVVKANKLVEKNSAFPVEATGFSTEQLLKNINEGWKQSILGGYLPELGSWDWINIPLQYKERAIGLIVLLLLRQAWSPDAFAETIQNLIESGAPHFLVSEALTKMVKDIVPYFDEEKGEFKKDLLVNAGALLTSFTMFPTQSWAHAFSTAMRLSYWLQLQSVFQHYSSLRRGDDTVKK